MILSSNSNLTVSSLGTLRACGRGHCLSRSHCRALRLVALDMGSVRCTLCATHMLQFPCQLI